MASIDLTRNEHLAFKVILGFFIRLRIIKGEIKEADLKGKLVLYRTESLAELFSHYGSADTLKSFGTGERCTESLSDRRRNKFNSNVDNFLKDIPNLLLTLDNRIKQAIAEKKSFAEINKIEKNKKWVELASPFIGKVFSFWVKSTLREEVPHTNLDISKDIPDTSRLVKLYNNYKFTISLLKSLIIKTEPEKQNLTIEEYLGSSDWVLLLSALDWIKTDNHRFIFSFRLNYPDKNCTVSDLLTGECSLISTEIKNKNISFKFGSDNYHIKIVPDMEKMGNFIVCYFSRGIDQFESSMNEFAAYDFRSTYLARATSRCRWKEDTTSFLTLDMLRSYLKSRL